MNSVGYVVPKPGPPAPRGPPNAVSSVLNLNSNLR